MSTTFLFGYARVSTKDQNLERQMTKLLEKGIDPRHIYTDKESGKDFDREGYQTLRKIVREGDLIYFDALDRLGRDFQGIISEWKYFTQEIKCDIVCLENEKLFDSRQFKQMGQFGEVVEHMFLGLLAYVADQERKKNLQRQKEGIVEARKKGVKFGRHKVLPNETFIAAYGLVKAGSMTAAAAARSINMSMPTWYRRVKDIEGGNPHDEKGADRVSSE